MYRKFPSIENAGIAYAIDTSYSYREHDRGERLAEWAYMFDTYGDGLTAHSPSVHVRREMILDFCASFGEFLVKLPPEERTEFLKEFHRWPDEADQRDLEFAYNLRFDEKKPYRYYSIRDRKVASKMPTVKLDEAKNWERVPEWADGKVLNMIRLLSPYPRDLLERYRLALDCYRFIMKQKKDWSQSPEALLELNEEHQLESRFAAISAIIESERLLQWANGVVESHRENLEYKRRRNAEKAAAESAKQSAPEAPAA